MVEVMSTKTSIFIGSTVYAANKSIILRIFLLLIIFFGLVLYIVDITSLNLHQFKFAWKTIAEDPWSWNYVQILDEEHDSVHRSYYVDQSGCRMPSFNETDASIEKYIFDVDTVQCKRPLLKSTGNFIRTNLNRREIQRIYKVKKIDDVRCTIEPFTRRDDFSNQFDDVVHIFQLNEEVKVDNEFVRVVCKLHKTEIYRDYFFFMRNEKTPYEKEYNKLNVLILGIDSVSRLNFRRRMNETYDLLANELKGFEMFGYNKVADNTYPNLIPALTGLDENELNDACMPEKSSTFDECHFIWDEYKDNNYTTTYMEDMSSLGLFHYLKSGFKKQPTDINGRPFFLEMENNIAKQKKGNTYLCLGGQRTIDVLLNNMKKITSTYKTSSKPHFSFFWTTSYTHDYLNLPKLIDSDVAQYLRDLSIEGILKNTFLILMSDHGMRYGSFRNTYQGMNEERQPFLFIIPPRWFLDKFPTAARNLAINRHRLTTHFDLYETLRDLIDLNSLKTAPIKARTVELLETEPMSRGISLFLPIPEQRTCYDACIEPHWCTCHEKEVLPTTDSRVERVARLIVDTMNRMINKYHECQKLYLNSISDANIGTSNNVTKDTINRFVDITVRLNTKPGLGEFEATVRVHASNELELTGTISRTNLYGKQSQCIDDYKLKLYCFCDILL